MILVGLFLFAARVPATSDLFVNLPLVLTVIQTAGLIFFISGVQIINSRLVWPGMRWSYLVQAATTGSTSAGLTMLALLIYNGLTTIAVVWWLTSAFGAGLSAGL